MCESIEGIWTICCAKPLSKTIVVPIKQLCER
jgi:hypothetical protein